MSQVCVTLPLLVLFSIRLVYGFPGDNVMLMPHLEVRNVDPYLTHPPQYTSQFQATRNKPQQVLNTNVMYKRQPQVPVTEKPSNQNMTFDEFMDALTQVAQHSQHKEEELQRLRTAEVSERDNNQAYPTLPRPVGYSRPNYAAPTTFHETPSVTTLTPPSSAESKSSLLKPDFGILSPGPSKSKFGGLISLIFSLLSSGSSGSQFSGLKDILIEGIIKPLFAAKGGLKALISKVTIPMIAMLLINIEVLVTIWWLWEECPVYVPESAPSSPTYSKPAAPSSVPPYNSNSNNYNSYR